MEVKNKTKQKYLDSSKAWKRKNKERVNKQRKEWGRKNPEKTEKYRANFLFGGNVQEVLERDNFQCQECGMNQEQHILIFGNRLNIHYIDGNGKNAKIKNNKIENLLTLCHDCHARLHHKLKKIEKWGELLEQDESEWKYPKLRELILSKVKEGNTITESKRIVAEELDVSFWTIDGYCYERKFLFSEQEVKK
jgi:hypothetical protein